MDPYVHIENGEILRNLERRYWTELQGDGSLIVRHGMWCSDLLPPADVPAYLAERRKAREMTVGQWGWLFLGVFLFILTVSAIGRLISPELAMSLVMIGLYVLVGYILIRRPAEIRRFRARYPNARPVSDPRRFTRLDAALRASNPFIGWLFLPIGSVAFVAMARAFAATADQAVSSLIVLPGVLVVAVMGVFLVCGPLIDRLHRMLVRRRLRWSDPFALAAYLVYGLLILAVFAIDVSEIALGA